MNEKQLSLIQGLLDSIDATLDLYQQDPNFAPADWILENWWNTLQVITEISSNPSEEP